MSGLPSEADKLLAVAAEEFVERRKALARELRDAGRGEEADAVAALRKPSAVVFAVNRAARDRPKAAESAAHAAEKVAAAQVEGDAEGFERAVAELSESLDLLAEVAAAHVAPGKSPSEAMRRRVRDLLRSAVADEAARERLRRGALAEELESAGFSPYAGFAAEPAKRSSARAEPSPAERRSAERAEKQREKLRALEDELEAAERRLEEATRAARAAEREREVAERDVQTLRRRIERQQS